MTKITASIYINEETDERLWYPPGNRLIYRLMTHVKPRKEAASQMRKKLIALLGAAVLTLGMSVTAFAAPSPKADVVANTASGQKITVETLQNYAKNTTLKTDVAGASIAQVEKTQAATLASAAEKQVGANATIASMVDISVPAGTGKASFTLGVPSLVSGQSVTVLHLKSDGSIEKLPVSAVSNGSVTFTMTSYSPVAVVVNATAPVTGEANMAVILVIALAGIAGAVVCGTKFARA